MCLGLDFTVLKARKELDGVGVLGEVEATVETSKDELFYGDLMGLNGTEWEFIGIYNDLIVI